MPALSNITVKKDDAVTDIVWTGVQPSSGDGTSAVWQSQTVGTALAHRPEARLSAREGSKGATRVLRITSQYPSISTNSTTGITSVYSRCRFAAEWVLDKSVPATDQAEFISQLSGFMNSTTFRSYIKSGFSAT